MLGGYTNKDIDMQRDLTARWLGFMSLFVIAFGLLLALGAHPMTSAVTGWLTDLIFFPVDGREVLAAPDARLYAAICGGVMVGWGVTLWLVVTRLLPVDPGLARSMLLSGTVCWFVVDSAGSFAAGAPLNVAANTLMLLAIIVPAWGIGRSPLAVAR